MSEPRKKKLPFKPTALRNRGQAPTPASTGDGRKSDDEDDDAGLALFSRARDMAPILQADRERKLRKRQNKLELERRRSIAEGKRPMRAVQDEDGDDEANRSSFGNLGSSFDDEKAHDVAADESMTVDGESFRNIVQVTPPPPKRSRPSSGVGSPGASRSSKRHHSAASGPSSGSKEAMTPSKRWLRSAKPQTPSRKPFKEAKTPSGDIVISLDSSSDEGPGLGVPTPSKSPLRHHSVVSMGDSSDDWDIAAPPRPSQQKPMKEEEEDQEDKKVHEEEEKKEVEDEDEDEFAEYIHKARAQRLRDKVMLEANASDTPNQKKETTNIMVTSHIPGTSTACIKYHFDRHLRLVRDSWIALQKRKGVDLPITGDDDIILTWQRKKVYNTSTLLNLGIRPQGDGRMAIDDYSKKGLDHDRTKVFMEAWTLELFQQMEAKEELQRRRDAGELSDEESDREPIVEQVKLRVKLVARGLEEVKLTVLKETTIETLITVFRKQRDIGSDREIRVFFDGEQLEEHDTMESVGIEDMDSVELHIN